MIDYIELSQTTPYDEPCVQLGSEAYMKNSRIEATVYIQQLIRVLGTNPPGSCFKIVHCPHDFGVYLDIRFFYDDEDLRHVEYMMKVESGSEKWDESAKNELIERGYPISSITLSEH